MVDNKKQKTEAEKLYRRYQETRDDIPLSILSTVNASAESALHEQSIHEIVEAAKVASHSNSEVGSTLTKKSPRSTSIVERIKNVLFGDGLSKPLGVGFACLAMVAILGPMFLKIDNEAYYAETAHLIDCERCDSYISDALVITRSTLTGPNQISAEDKLAAKLGSIQARLKIEALHDQAQAISNALSQINKQPKALLIDELANLSAQTLDIDSLVLAIDRSTSDLALTRAGEALFIADITSRYIAESKRNSLNQDSFANALAALKGLAAPTTLQRNATEKLELSLGAQPQDLKRIVKDLKFASRSLGL